MAGKGPENSDLTSKMPDDGPGGASAAAYRVRRFAEVFRERPAIVQVLYEAGYNPAGSYMEAANAFAEDLEALLGLEAQNSRLTEMYEEMRTQIRAAHALSCALRYEFDPEVIDRAAEEIDCGGQCDTAWRESDTNATGCTKSESAEGCPFEHVTELRAIAAGIRLKAWMAAFAPAGAGPGFDADELGEHVFKEYFTSPGYPAPAWKVQSEATRKTWRGVGIAAARFLLGSRANG